MSIRFRVFVFAMLSLPAFSWGAEPCKRLLAYGNPDYPPYLWRSSLQNETMSGAVVDYMALLSKEVGIPIEVKFGGTWARAQEEVRYGRADLLAGVFYTKERAKYLHYFNPPLTQTKTVVWMHESDRAKYAKWSDLIKLQGVTVLNNSFGEEFDRFARNKLKIDKVASLQQALDMLKNKRVSYLLYEEWPAKAYISQKKIQGLVAMTPEVAHEQLFVAISAQSNCNTPEIKERIESSLKRMSKLNPMPGLLKNNASAWDGDGQRK